MASTKVQRIALPVHDIDFIPLIKELHKLGKEPIVILPARGLQGLGNRLEQREVPVLFAFQERPKGRVLAVLEVGGIGKICVKEEDFELSDAACKTGTVAKHMEMLHYRKLWERATGQVLVPAVANFWYANELGPLRVYPGPILRLFTEMHDIWLHNAGKHLLSRNEEFAFVLPRTGSVTDASEVHAARLRVAAHIFLSGARARTWAVL